MKNFVLAVFATTFAISGIDILIPVLPVDFLKITGSTAAMGVLMGVTSFAAVLLRPFSSGFICRTGLKKSMVSGALVLSAAAVGYYFSRSFVSALVMRVFFGCGIILFFVSVWSLIGVIVPSEKRGFALSVYTVAFLFPYFYAPFLGSKLDGFAPFLVSGIFFVLAFLSCIFIDDSHLKLENKHGFVRTILSRDLLLPGLMIFSVVLADASVTVFLPVVAPLRPIRNYGLFFSVFSVSTIFVRLVLGKIYFHSNRHRFIILGMAVMFFGFVAVGFAKSLFMLLVAGFLYGVGFAFADPNLFAIIIEKHRDFSMTQVMACYGGFFDFGYAVGPLVMGIIYKAFGESWLYLSASAFVFSGILVSLIYFQRGGYVRV